jgi:endonuclease/exonuclease/phosphatase family metal-dependent hydrolase
MKHAWILLIPVLCACGASAPGPASPAGGADAVDIGIPQPWGPTQAVFYNVENLFDTKDDPATDDQDFLPTGELEWTEERYRHKLEQLANAISWTGNELPGIIGLAEVENAAVVKDLALTGALAQAPYTVVHFDSPDERGIDVALLVDDRRARVRRSEALPLVLAGDHSRDILYAELERKSTPPLHVFVAHWPSRREGQRESEPKRMAAARVVRDRVDALLAKDPAAQILIMGDLNDHPEDRSVQEGLAASCDPKSTADLFALMCMDRQPGEGSHQYNGEWAYLDQFIVSQALLPHCREARAFNDPRLLFRHPKFGPSPDKTYSGGRYKGGFSDHLPVVVGVD